MKGGGGGREKEMGGGGGGGWREGVDKADFSNRTVYRYNNAVQIRVPVRLSVPVHTSKAQL